MFYIVCGTPTSHELLGQAQFRFVSLPPRAIGRLWSVSMVISMLIPICDEV